MSKDKTNAKTIDNHAPAPAGADARPAIGQTAPAPLCVSVDGLAAMLAVSAHTVKRMDAGDALPMPLRFGEPGKSGVKRWVVDEVKRWMAAGCPSRGKWQAMRRK